jgi:pimeloyl-ACP methyl ester carboxylesterase
MRNNFTVQVNKATIHYNDEGSSEIPVVFIHGFPFDRTSWLPQYDFFKAHCRVVIYDIRGFGSSLTDSDTQFSMEVFAKDLLAFMKALSIEKAIVCGLSMGGYILMNALKLEPERFAGVILCDTQCNADDGEARQKRAKTIEQIRVKGTKDFADNFIKGAFHESSFDDKKEAIEAIREVILTTTQQTLMTTIKALANRPDTSEVLQALKVPALIICGKQDTVTPPERSQVMHDLIKNSVYKTIDKAGHLSNIEQPEEFNKIVGEFIKDIV